MKLDESIGLTYFDVEKTQEKKTLLDGVDYCESPVFYDDLSVTSMGRSEFSTPAEKMSYMLQEEIDKYDIMI